MTVNTPYSVTEPVMKALFAQLKTADGFKTYSRKLRLWTDVLQPQRPSLMLHEMSPDVNSTGKGIPQIMTLHAEVVIYTWAKGVETPSSLLNPLIDNVFVALRPSPVDGKLHLGLPYVDNCWINGKIIKTPGDLDGDGLAMIPVHVRIALPLPYPT